MGHLLNTNMKKKISRKNGALFEENISKKFQIFEEKINTKWSNF